MAEDEFLTALTTLEDVLADNGRRASLIKKRIAQLRRSRSKGASYTELVSGDRQAHRPAAHRELKGTGHQRGECAPSRGAGATRRGHDDGTDRGSLRCHTATRLDAPTQGPGITQPALANRRFPCRRRARVASAAARHAAPVPRRQGGHIGLDTWRTRQWYPALDAAGIRRGGPYQLRHTFATEALAAGISIFELARVMGASVKTIDQHYGHLARDSEQAIRDRLDARAERSGVVVASDPDA